MAYTSARVRPPIFDSALQAALERRAVEVLGLGLLVLSGLTAMMFTSYAPEDPSWLSASDAPVQNILGSFGAMIAAPIMLISVYRPGRWSRYRPSGGCAAYCIAARIGRWGG